LSKKKKKLGVFKLASCDGCQLSLLDLEDKLLEIAGAIEIAHFLEASSEVKKGPYDLALVEGSVTTLDDIDRIHHIRKTSIFLVTMGACATAGGIQALRNFTDVKEFISAVYANPEYISALDESTPVSQHVTVDFELRGCPVSKEQLLEVIAAFLSGRKPNFPLYSLCVECKMTQTVCVMVAKGEPCLGPVTQAGCQALCPSFHRGCYGCFGPMETPNTESLGDQWKAMGASHDEIVRAYRGFNAFTGPFQKEIDSRERK